MYISLVCTIEGTIFHLYMLKAALLLKDSFCTI